jgi:hypothetical protein
MAMGLSPEHLVVGKGVATLNNSDDLQRESRHRELCASHLSSENSMIPRAWKQRNYQAQQRQWHRIQSTAYASNDDIAKNSGREERKSDICIANGKAPVTEPHVDAECCEAPGNGDGQLI